VNDVEYRKRPSRDTAKTGDASRKLGTESRVQYLRKPIFLITSTSDLENGGRTSTWPERRCML